MLNMEGKVKKNKRILVLMCVLLLIFLVIFLLINPKENTKVQNEIEVENKQAQEFVQVLEDGTKLNVSSKLTQIKKLDSLEIGNIQLTNKDEQSVLLADVTNNGNTQTTLILVDIILYDKEGTQIAKIPGIISPLKPGETTQLNTTVQQDYSNAYDFEIRKSQ